MKTVIGTAALAGLAAAVPAPNTTTTAANCYTRTPIAIPSGPIFETGRWCVTITNTTTTTTTTYPSTAKPSAKQTSSVVPQFHDDDGEIRLRNSGLGSAVPSIPKPAMHGSVISNIRSAEPRITKAAAAAADNLDEEYRLPGHDGLDSIIFESGTARVVWPTQFAKAAQNITTMSTIRERPGHVAARGEPTAAAAAAVPSIPKPAMHGTVINAGGSGGCETATTRKTVTLQKQCRPTIKHTTWA